MHTGRAMAGHAVCALPAERCAEWVRERTLTLRARARARFIEYRRVLGTNLTAAALRNAAGAYVAPAFQQVAVPPNALPTSLASPDWERVQLASASAPCS